MRLLLPMTRTGTWAACCSATDECIFRDKIALPFKMPENVVRYFIPGNNQKGIFSLPLFYHIVARVGREVAAGERFMRAEIALFP